MMGRHHTLDEQALQYRHPGHTGEAEIVIGLDFGTSASKVVVQLPGLPGDPAYAVDFGDAAHPSMRFLLPTRLWVTPGGECTLCPRSDARLVRDIKLALFAGCEPPENLHDPCHSGVHPEAVAVAYLALVLRRARTWFLTAKRDIVGHLARLNWSVNLGVPSPCIENNAENRRFRRVGTAAWLVSLRACAVTIEHAMDQLRPVTTSPEDWAPNAGGPVCDFAIVPEIAAGAIGYAASALRREGLHLMVDVGASTLDICSFVLHGDAGDDRYSLLTADVQRLGTLRLHRERLGAVRQAYDERAREVSGEYDPLSPVPEDVEPYLLPPERVRAAIRRAEGELGGTCQRMLRRVILDLRRRRDPHAAAWRERLPILLIGGGAESRFFRSLVEDLGGWLTSHVGSKGVTLLPLELPSSVSTAQSEQHRLAVAWGLSHQEFNIGEIIPADRVADIPPRPCRTWEDQFVSKDQA